MLTFRKFTNKFLPVLAGLYRNPADHFALFFVPDHNIAVIAVPPQVDTNLCRVPKVKIFESHGAVRTEIGHVLIRTFLPVLTLLGQERAASSGVLDHTEETRASLSVHIAGTVGGNMSFPGKRTVIESAGSHLRLEESAVLKTDLFGAGLTRRLLAIGVAVIENVIFSADLNQRPVSVAGVHMGMFHIRNTGETDIAAADQDSSEGKSFRGLIAHGIAEIMAVQGTVDKIILPVELPHGYAAIIQPRSGFACKGMQVQAMIRHWWFILLGVLSKEKRIDADVIVGLVDEDYRNNVGALVKSNYKSLFRKAFLPKGTRIAQMRIVAVPETSLIEVEELDMTKNRGGGYGHTGAK